MLEYLKVPLLVTCSIAFHDNDTTLYSLCAQASDLWQQLELNSKLVT